MAKVLAPYAKYTDAKNFNPEIPIKYQFKKPKGWHYMPTHQFHVPKLNSTILRKHGFEITTTYEELAKNDCIIALADNQLLATIRDITNHPYTADNYIKAKRVGNLKTYQFIPEYLTVVVDHLNDYFRMKSGKKVSDGIEHFGKFQTIKLTIDGETREYVRLSCSPAQARKNIVIFGDKKIVKQVQDRLDAGRNIHSKMAGTKFNAYFGLYSSASQPVTMPRICIVGSYESTEPVRMMYEQPPHEGESEKEFFNRDSDLLEIEEELDFVRFDGGGLIRPEMAICWAHDLNLDYCPSDFCIRFTYTKGAVVTFDWVEWCNEYNNGNYIVKDYFGNDVDLSQVDIIITPDMAKMIGQWDSVAQYMEESRKAGIEMRVTKYAHKADKISNTLNYQYIQTLAWPNNFPYNWEYLVKTHGYEKACEIAGVRDDDLYEMAKNTIDHFKSMINNHDKIELSLVGDFYNTMSGTDWFVKSAILCPSLFDEEYAKLKVYHTIEGAIQDAKLGKGIEHGNYQCLIPDPFAHMQYICGHEVTGILQDGEFYSNFWAASNTERFSLARSPQTYRSEWVKCKNVVNETTNKWFMHLYSGIVCPVHGHYTMDLAGSDFDYDIGFTTDDDIIYRNIYDDKLVTGYDVPKPAKEDLVDHKDEKLAICDSFSFGQKIGQITNLSTSLYCMQTRFDEGTPEYNLIENRLMQLCIAQSKQIDKTKLGRKVKEIPSCWVKETGDPVSDAVIVSKKPYFMKYRYDELGRDYSNWYKKWSDEAWSDYYENGVTTDNVEKALDLCPVMLDPCPMNRWAWYIEAGTTDISIKTASDTLFNPIILIAPQKEAFDYDKYYRIKTIIHNIGAINANSREVMLQLLKKELTDIAGNDLQNYLARLFFYDERRRSKGLFWDLVGEEVFYHLLNNKIDKAFGIVEDVNGDIDFLYKKYKKVTFTREELQHMLW